MGLRLELLPPPRFQAGFLNWANQNFSRIQQALSKGASLASSTTEPSDPASGDLWMDTTTKTVKIFDGTEFLIVGSYESRDWTPVIGQAAATGRTVLSASYQIEGDYVTGDFFVSMTGTGTANTAITITGVPIAPTSAMLQGMPVGGGYLYNASVNQRVPCMPILLGSPTRFVLGEYAVSGGLVLGEAATSFAEALVSGDAIGFNFRYRWR